MNPQFLYKQSTPKHHLKKSVGPTPFSYLNRLPFITFPSHGPLMSICYALVLFMYDYSEWGTREEKLTELCLQVPRASQGDSIPS